jgi:NAD(P)-dependent dehydrogenase (short-subunit alcohol dehydrogenase family)
VRVFIFGGTRGLGLALAKHYLALGDTVAVAGRSGVVSEQTQTAALAHLHCFALDIADSLAVQNALHSFAAKGIDLVIVTAGIYFNDRQQPLDVTSTQAILNTNVQGLAHVLQHASALMLNKSRRTGDTANMSRRTGDTANMSRRTGNTADDLTGHVVAVSSIAGLLADYPGASLYSASKRSVLQLCESYRLALAPFAIAVTTVVPGYIDTAKLRELNGGSAKNKPFLVSETYAVSKITQAITDRKSVVVFPWQMHWIIRLLNCLPKIFRQRLLLRRAPPASTKRAP